MAKKDIWMPLYIGDYLADTQLLTTEQHGAYLLLIFAYWRARGLPNDDDVLMGIAKMKPDAWKKSRSVILQFFHSEGGGLVHKRINSELVRAEEKQTTQSESGRAGAAARWGENGKADGKRNGKTDGKRNGKTDGKRNGKTDGKQHASHSHHMPVPVTDVHYRESRGVGCRIEVNADTGELVEVAE